MTVRNVLVTILGVAILAGSGLVLAQEKEETTPTEEPSPATKLPLPEGGDDVLSDAEIRQLSSKEKLSQAQEMIGEMKGSLANVNTLLEDSRRQERDIRKINCINQKFVSIKGFLKVSEQSYVALKDSTVKDDTEASVHHYSMVMLSNSKVERLEQDARFCVGSTMELSEEGEREVIVSPDIAPVEPVYADGSLDPNADPFDEFVPDRIVELTPFQ